MELIVRKIALGRRWPPVEHLLLVALWGMMLGFFVLSIFQLPSKFSYYLTAGPIILLIAILSGKFKRFFQGLLIFIIPINFATHFFRRPYRTYETGLDFSPLDIVLIVLYAIWIYELLIKKDRTFDFFPRMTIPVFSLVAITAVSMISANDPLLSLFVAIKIFKVALIYLYVANHLRTKKDIVFVLVLLLVGLFIQSAIAFAQKWLGMSLGLNLFGEFEVQRSMFLTQDYYITVSRVGGTLGHPNNLAKYAELLLPLPLVLLFTGMKPRLKLMSAIVFICGLIALLLTLSRGGWVSFAGSMILLLFLIFRAKLISIRTLIAIAFMIVILGSVGLVFSGLVTARLFGDDYGAAYARIPLNKVALKTIQANPIWGVGAKNYWSVMDLYNPNLEAIEVNIVHNTYLLIAAETGLIGLLVFLWFIWSAFRQGLRNLRIDDIFLICINVGILSGMASFLAHWLVDFGYIADYVIFWVFLAIIAATRNLSRRQSLVSSKGQMAG